MEINKADLIEIINAVIDAREKINNTEKLESDCLDKLCPALCKMQGEFTTVIPTKRNPRFKSKYADYDDIMTMARPHLAANGFSVSSNEEKINGEKYIRTKLRHSSGQYISSLTEVIADTMNKTAIQAYGSALSYHRRYSLQGLLGISINDDVIENDGNPPEKTNETNKHYNKNNIHKTNYQPKLKQQIQTQKNNNIQSKPKPPEAIKMLSASEIEFLDSELKGWADIREKIRKNILGSRPFEECPKSLFDKLVEYIETEKKKFL